MFFEDWAHFDLDRDFFRRASEVGRWIVLQCRVWSFYHVSYIWRPVATSAEIEKVPCAVQNVSWSASVPATRSVTCVVSTVLIGFLIRANCLGTVKLFSWNRSILFIAASVVPTFFPKLFQSLFAFRPFLHNRIDCCFIITALLKFERKCLRCTEFINAEAFVNLVIFSYNQSSVKFYWRENKHGFVETRKDTILRTNNTYSVFAQEKPTLRVNSS